jgi:hypothetical protein
MNERIRELALQAEVKWLHQEDVIYSTMTLEQFEKFAELIVRECASEAAYWTPNEDQGAEDREKHILQHFGVEE